MKDTSKLTLTEKFQIWDELLKNKQDDIFPERMAAAFIAEWSSNYITKNKDFAYLNICNNLYIPTIMECVEKDFKVQDIIETLQKKPSYSISEQKKSFIIRQIKANF